MLAAYQGEQFIDVADTVEELAKRLNKTVKTTYFESTPIFFKRKKNTNGIYVYDYTKYSCQDFELMSKGVKPMQEKWKQIAEAPRYYVSNKGRVAYIPKSGKAKYKFAKTTFNNYILQVSLYLKNDKHATRSVAKLVATAFIDNPHSYYYIKHKNGNPFDNSVANLKWQKTNLKYSARDGKYYPRGKHRKVDELFYKILASIENDYGDVTLCPEYDERLLFLRTY